DRRYSSGLQLSDNPIKRGLHRPAHRIPSEFDDTHLADIVFCLVLAKHARDPVANRCNIGPPLHESGTVGDGTMTRNYSVPVQFEGGVRRFFSAGEAPTSVVVDVARERRR